MKRSKQKPYFKTFRFMRWEERKAKALRRMATLIALTAVMPAPVPAQGQQYMAVVLPNSGTLTHAEARGISSQNTVVGYGWDPAAGGFRHPLVWNIGTNPIGVFDELAAGMSAAAFNGVSFALNEVRVVGAATGGVMHAVRHPGFGSFVDLHPLSGFDDSEALAASSIDQVGWGSRSATGSTHALLWFDTAASVVDLHPQVSSGQSQWSHSVATSTDSIQQAGWGVLRGVDRALLWSGSATSFVDLHPSGFDASQAHGVFGGAQVGWGSPTGSGTRNALLWGSSASAVTNLNPSGFGYSEARAVHNFGQAGFGRGSATGGVNHALLWRGNAASVVDLHSFLPTGFATSYAYNIISNGDIAGTAITSTGISNAVLWRRIHLSLLRLSQTTISYGTFVIATVTLNLPAPSSGATIKLGTSAPYAQVPESVPILAGKTQANFTIRTAGDRPSSPVKVTITATYGGETLKAVLTIKP